MVCVLLQDFLSIFVCVEGVHEDQWDISVVRLVQVLLVIQNKQTNKLLCSKEGKFHVIIT